MSGRNGQEVAIRYEMEDYRLTRSVSLYNIFLVHDN